MLLTVCRMIRRLEHWLQVLPPVKGSDIQLMNPLQAKQLCTTMDTPATTSPPSEVDHLQRSNSTDANADADRPDVEKVSEVVASDLQRPQVDCTETLPLPDFPLLPVSRGFQMKLQKLLAQFETTLTASGITVSRSCSPF